MPATPRAFFGWWVALVFSVMCSVPSPTGSGVVRCSRGSTGYGIAFGVARVILVAASLVTLSIAPPRDVSALSLAAGQR